jgi:hypothetical protein
VLDAGLQSTPSGTVLMVLTRQFKLNNITEHRMRTMQNSLLRQHSGTERPGKNAEIAA